MIDPDCGQGDYHDAELTAYPTFDRNGIEEQSGGATNSRGIDVQSPNGKTIPQPAPFFKLPIPLEPILLSARVALHFLRPSARCA
jgi:hypothetical protein